MEVLYKDFEITEKGVSGLPESNIFTIDGILKSSSPHRLNEVREHLMDAEKVYVKALENYDLDKEIEEKAQVYCYSIMVEPKRELFSSFKKKNVYYPGFLIEMKKYGSSNLFIFPMGKYPEIFASRCGVAEKVAYDTLEDVTEALHAIDKLKVNLIRGIVHPLEIIKEMDISIE